MIARILTTNKPQPWRRSHPGGDGLLGQQRPHSGDLWVCGGDSGRFRHVPLDL